MLEGRVILITGSTGGIGHATATLCRRHGAKVVLHGRDETRLRAAAREMGEDTSHVAADLTNPDAPRAIIDFVIDRFSRLDGLVNNAAMLDRCTIDTFSNALFDEMMVVNLRAPLMLIKAAIPHMERQPHGGSIVNIGSVNAHCGASKILAYSVSKGGLMTATRNLGNALCARHIRVNQLNVGWTATENEHKLQALEGRPADWKDRIAPHLRPSGDILTPGQVAEHVVFWLSDRSAPITGQVVDIEQYPVIGRL